MVYRKDDDEGGFDYLPLVALIAMFASLFLLRAIVPNCLVNCPDRLSAKNE